MKQLWIAVLFIVIVWCVHAQTGAYGLTYGDSISVARAKLEAEGFMELVRAETHYSFVCGDEDDYTVVNLYVPPDEETVVMWIVYFLIYEDIEIDLLDWLIELHGDFFSHDDARDVVEWILTPERWVQLGYDDSKAFMKLAYYDEDHIRLIE